MLEYQFYFQNHTFHCPFCCLQHFTQSHQELIHTIFKTYFQPILIFSYSQTTPHPNSGAPSLHPVNSHIQQNDAWPCMTMLKHACAYKWKICVSLSSSYCKTHAGSHSLSQRMLKGLLWIDSTMALDSDFFCVGLTWSQMYQDPSL